MSLTGEELLTDFSKFIGDYQSSTSTGAGSTSTLVDTYLSRYGDDKIIDWYLRVTENVNGNQYLVRRISDFVSSTGTCTVAPLYAGVTASGTDYQLHRYDPAEKFTALDEARIRVFPDLCILRYNDTLTGDGINSVFDIPTNVRRGPLRAVEENPLQVQTSWNFITSPLNNSTTGWTSSSVTASIVTRSAADLLIPKYDSSCTKLVVAASTLGGYSQTVGNMTGMTAALAAGRKMTFAAWVFCMTSAKVTLKLTDDSTTTTSSIHGGGGWELMTVTKTNISTNATTLTARFDIANSAGAVVMYINRSWLYYGDANRVQDIYRYDRSYFIRRDDTTQKVYLDWVPEQGHQLRIIGQDILSELGSTISTQVTNTMEVDDPAAQILYAEAAKILFAKRGLNTANVGEVAIRVQAAERLKEQIRKEWKMLSPQGRGIRTPWTN
jgi:hypothetical protein